ncbi:PTS fructose transporter subunit IIABC [Mycoplasma leonicaptivi]|uniref:PTS fructose transporter subunit IIABC n=1 Tax=Mycoplasma leonicaptivi TaxID=36742 RepID=UPI0004898E51|nr:fructose-specific PTS transporter subunit EIIC [Mycoplasma leonicaptivi]
MKITSLFKDKDTIFLNESFKNKDQALEFIANELYNKKYVSNYHEALNLFKQREQQASTGIGDKIAMPHIGSDIVLKNTLVFIKTSNLDWKSIDNQDINYIFGIVLSGKERDNSHIKIMQKLSQILINPDFNKRINEITNKDEFISLLDELEQDILKKETSVWSSNNTYDIVAVTACPTGIAHTFLAKEKILEYGTKMGVKIKVETQGAEGIDNKLSEDEIKNAKGVLLAVDREIEKSRFTNHDNVLEVSTQKAIHTTEEQIEKLLNQKGQKISSNSKSSTEEAEISFDGFGKRMYRSLMTGISHMLPFIVFGGIILAFAFLLDMIIGLASGVDINSKTFLSSFGFNHYVSKTIFDIGKIGLGLAVPILSAYIAFSLVGRQGLLPGFVVGNIASGSLAGTYGFLAKSIASSGLDSGSFLGTGSGFIGGILGAFFAAAMVIVFSKYVFGKLPKTMQGIKNILFIPVLGTVTIAILFWVLNIVFIYINLGLVLFLKLFESKPYLAWILGLILGVMMATDLGGPINKAAYIFGTLTIANGTSSIPMAAVMASGMVPPLGISISMFISKKLWSKEDIQAGKWSNIIFGASFISEGAIPYTSKRPKMLIPANIVGGAVAGIISAALSVNIIAPHGGIFVIFLAKSNLFESLGMQIGFGILFWLSAIIVGAFASAGTMLLMNYLNNKYPNLFKIKKRAKRQKAN